MKNICEAVAAFFAKTGRSQSRYENPELNEYLAKEGFEICKDNVPTDGLVTVIGDEGEKLEVYTANENQPLHISWRWGVREIQEI